MKRHLVLAFSIGGLLFPWAAPADSLHPPLKLLDKDGVPVIRSQKSVSTRSSCGPCHDYDFITHSLHVQQGRDEHATGYVGQTRLPKSSWSPGMYGKYCSMPNRQVPPVDVDSVDNFDLGAPEWVKSCGSCHPGGGPAETDNEGRRLDSVDPATTRPLDIYYHSYDKIQNKLTPWDWRHSGVVEINCFLCHTENFNDPLRKDYIREGAFGDAVNASLAGTGVVEEDEESGTLKYIKEAFAADGSLKAGLLPLKKPGVNQCGKCHGFAAVGEHAGEIRPFDIDGDIRRGTKKMGRIWSSALIKDSDAPVRGKEKLDFPWDIHAAKGLTCVDCHFSLNNPSRMIRQTDQAHLKYEPRATDPTEYLKRPDHNFAKGSTFPETVRSDLSYSMRGCLDCHDPMAGQHQWLPYAEHHFRKLDCETCHVPHQNYWSYQQLDISAQDRPAAKARGVLGDYRDPKAEIVGFQPAYIPRLDREGVKKITTVNPITSLIWLDAGRGHRPAFERELTSAFYVRDENFKTSYRPEMVKAFDRNGDGKLDREELRMDTAEKVAVAQGLLRQAGLKEPELELEMIAFGMNHNVVKETALRDCLECHRPASRLFAGVEIFDYVPAKAKEECLVCGPDKEAPIVNRDGKVYYCSKCLLKDFYLVGASRNIWVEVFGWLSVVGAVLFGLAHGSLRWWALRKGSRNEKEEGEGADV